MSNDDSRDFDGLLAYLRRVPGISGSIGHGRFEHGTWWVKFSIDIDHPLAWQVVQEMGHVLNYLGTEERLPTVFMPVSPPPALNGGPREFLSWVIESQHPEFEPELCMKWLEGRLPRPVDDAAAWEMEEE